MVSSPRSKPGGGGAGRHPGSLNPFHGGGPFDSWVLRSMSGACFKKRMSFPLFLLFPVFPSLLDSHTWSLTCLILCRPKKPCVPSRTGLPPGCCPFTCSFCSPPSTLLARALWWASWDCGPHPPTLPSQTLSLTLSHCSYCLPHCSFLGPLSSVCLMISNVGAQAAFWTLFLPPSGPRPLENLMRVTSYLPRKASIYSIFPHTLTNNFREFIGCIFLSVC